jgi:hypothetical protein
MLVRPDATYLDEVTKQPARVFPVGSGWLDFESQLPGKEVFEGSIYDPPLAPYRVPRPCGLRCCAGKSRNSSPSTPRSSCYDSMASTRGRSPSTGSRSSSDSQGGQVTGLWVTNGVVWKIPRSNLRPPWGVLAPTL